MKKLFSCFSQNAFLVSQLSFMALLFIQQPLRKLSIRGLRPLCYFVRGTLFTSTTFTSFVMKKNHLTLRVGNVLPVFKFKNSAHAKTRIKQLSKAKQVLKLSRCYILPTLCVLKLIGPQAAKISLLRKSISIETQRGTC